MTDWRVEEKNQAIVDELVAGYRAGSINRRDFLSRSAVVLGGAGMANALLLATQDAPFVDVLKMAGQLDQATPPATQPPPPNIETLSIKFKSGTEDVPGYMAKPKGEGPFAAVIVLQEWWGVDDHIKSVVDRFAAEGYVALAPDLYRGEVAKEPSDAQRLVMKVQLPKAVADVQAAVDHLNAQKIVKMGKIGVIGFCFGGRIAMNMSYAGKNIAAVATFYGGGLNPTDADFKAVSVPVIGFYGDQDGGIPVDRVKQWEAKFKEAGKVNEMYIYKDAPHAFFNDSRPSYRKEAATDAWTKTLAWFKKYLGDNAAVSPTMAATQAATPAATPGR
jgi:carboxymethylenebutenolidase